MALSQSNADAGGGKYMPEYPGQFPPLPWETARAAKSVFNIKNIYLAIGDQLAPMFGDLNTESLNAFGERPGGNLFILAMVTVFQFIENMPDRQAADAVRKRMDWKYALHLSLDHPGLDAATLKEFRCRLWDNLVGQELFQVMLNRLSEAGFLGDRKRSPNVATVLHTVDTLSRLEDLVEAMMEVLEVLASRRPDLLRRFILPHWYERYIQMFPVQHYPISNTEQKALAKAIEADISYLLEAIDEIDAPDLRQLPEIKALRYVRHQQFPSHRRV